MRTKIGLWTITIFLLSQPVFAVLDLELTQGTDRAIPIAIIPFKTSQPLPTDVTRVITDDLYHSGELKPIDGRQMPEHPQSIKSVNLTAWSHAKIDNILMGDIKPEGGDRYRISFSLFNTYRTNFAAANAKQNPIILSQSYTVNGKDLRRIAHKISDEVYEKLIGERGVFSTKIAYILEKRQAFKKSHYFLMISDADGNNPRAILTTTQPIMSPAWAPNGKQIAYVSFENTRASIFISDILTGQRRLVSQFPGINAAPAFSPDGRQLALVLSKSGSLKIYTLDLTTKRLEQVTSGFSIDTEPSWSPDGKSIIFTSDRSGSPQIYRLDLVSKTVERLTFTGDYNARASFTLDGNSLILLHRENGVFTVAVQNLMNGALNVLSDSSNNQSPSVSPNGKLIIYGSNEEEQGTLAIVSLDGNVKLRFPENNGLVREPVWGPFTK